MQETGDRRSARDGELQLSQLAGQALGGFFISPVSQHLRLFRQLIALDVRIGSNAVKVCRMEPVTTAYQKILFLTGLLLPVHRLFGPFKDPVAAAERRLDRLLRSGIKPTHQRGGFRMFESGFKQRFAKVSLGHVQPPSCCH